MSVNKAILVGSLGRNPETRVMQSGDKVVNLSMATNESWRDKSTGERKERTEWHNVVIFNQMLVGIAEKYLKKGSRIYVEGTLETRKWEKDGVNHYRTEIVLRPFRGDLRMLDSKPGGQSSVQRTNEAAQAPLSPPPSADIAEGQVPF